MRYGLIMPDVFPFGLFIKRIEQTKTSDESGGENIFTVELTDHSRRHFVVKNGHTGSACEGINEIRASVDNSVGTPSVEVVETDAGTKKDINFIFKNLKGEVGDTKAKMPLNPVRAYDMADEWRHEKLLYKISTPIINKKEATIIQYHAVYTKNQAETYYHVHVESSSTGNAQPALILYRQDWAPQTYIIWEYCNGVQDFFVSIPQQNFDFGIGIWMHGDGSYQVQPDDSVTVHKFTVTEITEKRLIDSSGTGNHATITVDAVKVNDNTVGTALLLMKGSLTSNFSSFIGVGKQWTHSRWIKIDENAQDKTTNTRLWWYGQYDYAIMDIAANNGVVSDISLLCYKDAQNLHQFYIEKARIIDNQWHNLIVMTDLQKTYCWRSFYLDGKKIGEKRIEANFENFAGGKDFIEMPNVKGSLANLLFFDRFLTEAEILWVSRNPYYPAKRYSLAEYKADETLKMIESLKKG